MIIIHYPWKNTTPFISCPLALPASFLSARIEGIPSVKSPLLLVDVLMPNDFVGDPVEHVEDEEGQGEGRPGDGVYSLGSVHKLLSHGVQVFGHRRLRVRGWGSIFHGRAVLCRRRLTHVVAGKIKAAFAHVFILPDTMSEHRQGNMLTWPLHGAISHSGSVSLLPVDQFILPIFCLFCARRFYPVPSNITPRSANLIFLFIFLKTLSSSEQRKWMSDSLFTGKCIR